MRNTTRIATLTLLLVAVPVIGVCSGQDPSGKDDSYELYLTQIAAAEAFLQLNEISTAYRYLSACEERYRGLEWRFLASAIDQSDRTVRKKGEETFTAIAASPTGNVIAAAGSDSTIALFTYPGMDLRRVLRGHTGPVSTLAFSNDGTRLASGGRDHTVIVWDSETGAQVSRNDAAFTQGIYQVTFSPDDAVLGVVSWERLPERKPNIFGFAKFLDANDARELLRVELDNHPAAGIVFTPDGRSAIVATWGEVTYSIDVETGARNWNFDLSDASEYNAFHSIDISADGKSVALGSADRRIYLLDAADGKVVHRIESSNGHSKTLKAVAFSPDGAWLATAGDDQTILVWDTRDYSRRQALIGHVNTVSGLAWTRDGSDLLSSSLDGSVKAWDLDHPFATTREICDFGPWQTPVSADGRIVAAPCSDRKLRLYLTSTGGLVADLGEQSGLCADISSDAAFLVTASFDGIVRLWDVQRSAEVRSFQGHTKRVDGVAYMNATKRIVSVGDSTLRVWGTDDTRELHVVRFNATPFRVVLSPDDSRAYVGFADGTVRILDAGRWVEIGSIRCGDAIQEMTMSPDGQHLAIFSGKNVELWDARSHVLVTRLSGHEKAGYGVGFSPDGKYVISGSYDQTFRIWNLEKQKCTLTYHGLDAVAYSSKFLSLHEIYVTSPEGQVWYYEF